MLGTGNYQYYCFPGKNAKNIFTGLISNEKNKQNERKLIHF